MNVWETALCGCAERGNGQRFRAVTASAIALGLLVGWLLPAEAAPVSHGVAAGMLNVVQTSQVDTNTNAEVTLALSINQFQLGSFNRADYDVRIGTLAEASSNMVLGVLMTSVTENGRNNFGTNGYPTSAFATNGNGAYRIVSFLGEGGGAGSAIEYNVNVAGAWFPYDRYLGGFARNATGANGGTNDTFTGSPGLVLGTHFKGVTAGKSVVDLRSFGIDSRTNGVLLVTHAKDENNFALSQVNSSDGTWNVFVRDNAQPTYASNEQDPVACVFIPRTETILAQVMRREDWLARWGDILIETGRPAEARKSYEAALAAVGRLPGQLQRGPAMVKLQSHVNAALGGITNAPLSGQLK
jgi:hypothetical protein